MCSEYTYINVSKYSVPPPDTNAVTYLSPQYHAASLLILDKSFGLHLLSHLLDGGRRLVRCFSNRFLGLFAGFLSSFGESLKGKKGQ